MMDERTDTTDKFQACRETAKTFRKYELETVSIAEPLQNRQHAPLMLSALGSMEKREGG